MAQFTLTITAFTSDASRDKAARVIASAEGYFVDERETLELLSVLPATLTFEAEAETGQDTVEKLKAAGCELSAVVEEEDVWDRRTGGEFAERSLIVDYSEDTLERLESRFDRIPPLFWGLAGYFFVVGWILGVWFEIMPMIAAPIQVALFAFAAIGAKGAELWGYVTCIGASLLGLLINGVMFISAVRTVTSPFDNSIADWLLLCCTGLALIPCVYLFAFLLKKPVRRWFS